MMRTLMGAPNPGMVESMMIPPSAADLKTWRMDMAGVEPYFGRNGNKNDRSGTPGGREFVSGEGLTWPLQPFYRRLLSWPVPKRQGRQSRPIREWRAARRRPGVGSGG